VSRRAQQLGLIAAELAYGELAWSRPTPAPPRLRLSEVPPHESAPMSDSSPQLLKRIRQDVQSMHAYAIQDSVGMIKLDAMENPHSLPHALQALGQRLGALALNRYPDGRVNDLRHALAAYAGMPGGFDIMLGNGSDELISLLAMACDVPGASVLAPVPGFVMYAMSAQLQGLRSTACR
jgi:histidinol-phosphate aminotransferase